LGETATIRATVADFKEYRAKGGLLVGKARVFDDSASMTLTFFNNRYLKNSLTAGGEYYFFGEAKVTLTEISMTSPRFEKIGQDLKWGAAILPLYSLKEGLSQTQLRKNVKEALGALRRPDWGVHARRAFAKL
jgi:ATP-dependent DNA helicase RecG